jgi:hypothetical protein
MTIIVRVEVVDENTKEVKKTFVVNTEGGNDYNEVWPIREVLDKAFKIEYGEQSNEWI